MNIFKIDKVLLRQISILAKEKKVHCFVFGKDFSQTKRILDENNIHIENEYLFINAFLCKASQREIFSLSNVNVVEGIYSLSVANTLMFVSKNILQTEKIGLLGEGVNVAFIDTGLSPHMDFLIGKNRVKHFKDFVNNKKFLYDDNGHGTFVCGACSGCGAMSNFRYSGIAPRSNIFALKALDENGEATANRILDAMEWIFDNHKKRDVKVVCMSFGSEPLGHNDPIMLGAEALWKDGVVVVAAAGNSGPEYQTIKSPGISDKIITVGGIDDKRYKEKFDVADFEIAEFSSRGPAFRKVKPDMVAPSVDIVSCGIEKPYTRLSGTSVATPMIAGLCCLLLEKYPFSTPDQIKRMLLQACRPLGFGANLEGYGMPILSN